MTHVTYPGPQDFSHVSGGGTGLQNCICRSKSPINVPMDRCCPIKVAATAEAELMRMIAGKIYIVIVSIDNVSITDDMLRDQEWSFG